MYRTDQLQVERMRGVHISFCIHCEVVITVLWVCDKPSFARASMAGVCLSVSPSTCQSRCWLIGTCYGVLMAMSIHGRAYLVGQLLCPLTAGVPSV
jgi:hypothetical protein